MKNSYFIKIQQQNAGECEITYYGNCKPIVGILCKQWNEIIYAVHSLEPLPKKKDIETHFDMSVTNC